MIADKICFSSGCVRSKLYVIDIVPEHPVRVVMYDLGFVYVMFHKFVNHYVVDSDVVEHS